MTGAEIAQIITSIATLAGVLGGVFVSLRNGRKADENSRKIESVHKATNGLSEKLRAASLAQGTAEGTAAGLKQGREEHRGPLP